MLSSTSDQGSLKRRLVDERRSPELSKRRNIHCAQNNAHDHHDHDPKPLQDGAQIEPDRLSSPGASKHLVKTLSDLPKFLAVDGFRVASYALHGEPHFCLPHLLQYAQRKYPLDKLVETFERTQVDFPSASSKQVEGFVKAGVLPQSAAQCPLIKRSDAERICLILYDQLCLDDDDDDDDDDEDEEEERREEDKNKTQHRQNGKTQSSRLPAPSSTRREPSLVEVLGESKSHHQVHDEDSNQQARPAAARTESGAPGERGVDENQLLRDEAGGKTSDEIFGTDAQSPFLSLARAATSTLRIKVYHRCFGKCNGFYYPARLRNAQSKCIECAECHRLLSPRRFIGHTHRSREENVCHWGFDSHMWRHYIYLYKNQDINRLDDDELLVQLDKLKSVPDVERGRSLAKAGHAAGHDAARTISAPAQRLAGPNAGVVKCEALEPSTSCASGPSKISQFAAKTKPEPARFAWPLPQGDQQRNTPTLFPPPNNNNNNNNNNTSCNGFQSKMTSHQNTHSSSGGGASNGSTCSSRPSSGAIQSTLNNFLSNPLLFAHNYRTSQQAGAASARSNLNNFALPQFGPYGGSNVPLGPFSHLQMPAQSQPQSSPTSTNFSLSSLYQSSLTTGGSIKQDMFVSSILASYLSSRGLDSNLIRDIIEQTLAAITKSRLLF